ncbi:beta-lactamase/transpeptidase-like protein [Aaosphaeria arxii CBS 175.79]|uniref:Beta-lactamase/transpeptidase-like protein n=1 Tax=Aaosphaeria arxii CBS 175.79 TaxID=1450172 RepID=A0A6A5XJJ8_9PLEO|nr:beta-lactamase/transpeptidase-like protein [Aaosphaeria arxii CBS 175.79]KAF2012474.1 beta-lactamase/transpeptidase-like protein [Aaosphaeria arxii CBS 175.79]
MADFEKALESAVSQQHISGAVVQARNRDGSFNYCKALGSDPDSKPYALNTVMWIASCTKLMTSISALQLVERGQVTLDDPIYKHIPELKDHPILEDFNEDGSPIETPHKTPITLRHLLTHSSGLSYDALHPKLIAWLKYHGREPSTSGKLLERFSAPLVFEPGTSWMYGPGIDYAGLLVERISGLTLEEYMRKNLWEPLGIKDMTFKLSTRPDLSERRARMSKRPEGSETVGAWDEKDVNATADGSELEDCLGGQGVYTSIEEYLKVLVGLLTTDENEKILKKETVELFFTPNLGEGSTAMLNAVLQDDMSNNAMGGLPKDIKKDWGLGGLLVCGDVPNEMKENTMIWGGLPNLIWWVDRKDGVCGLFATQLLPTGDSKCAVLNRQFTAGIYQLYAKHRVSPRL